MTKLIQILIAERDRKARLINDAANSSVTERKALIAQLNDAIEDAKKSVERCEDLINKVDRVEERHWGRDPIPWLESRRVSAPCVTGRS